MSHPYDAVIPAPWLPDWEELAASRDSCARCVARALLDWDGDAAVTTLLLRDFRLYDAVVNAAPAAYRQVVAA